MARAWTTGRRPLIVAVGLLLLASQLPSAWAGTLASVPREVVRFVLIPGEGVLRVASLALRPGRSRAPSLPPAFERRLAELAAADPASANQAYDNYLELQTDNQRLRNRVEELEDEVRQLNLVREGLGDRPLAYVNARVTSHTATDARRSITIDRGSASGVEVGQAVVSGASLVGTVSSVTGRTADVKLMNGPGQSLRARIVPAEAGPPREITEQLRVTADGSAFTAEIDRARPVEVGDLAHLVDRRGAWPTTASGRVVGVVAEVRDDTDRPLQLKRLVVRPLLDYAKLARVTVVREAEE
jgi:cell shape-determining protein MreC